MTPNTLSADDHDSLPKWTSQDDAEYNRLATEMNEDAKLQFTFFTFGITASTAVLGFLTSTAVSVDSVPIPGLPLGAFFLVPLIILYPTSLLILNRARTRNRKAAYVITHLDYKRLAADGITNDMSLNDVREHPFLPWETALHILERTNKRVRKNAHFPPALRYIYLCYTAIELLCIFLAFFTSLYSELIPLAFMMVIVIVITALVYKERSRRAKLLTNELSIQGCVKRLIEYKYQDTSKAPRYLQEWIREFIEEYKAIPPIQYSDKLKLEGSLPDLSLVAPSNLILVEYQPRN